MPGLLSLTGRVAIVTGSSSGTGRAIALALASEGASVVCSDLDPNARQGGYETSHAPTHDEIVAKGKSGGGGTGSAIFQKADVASEDDVEKLVARAVSEYGRLDILINNAGIFCGPNNIVDEPVSAFDKTLAVNTRGVFLGMKYAITQMLKQDPLPSGERGWIVNVASIGGQVGLPLEPSYCASKGAVVNLTRQVAVDYGPHRIHVNAVCPGAIATAMIRDALDSKDTRAILHAQTPWPELGTAEDVAKAVLVLAGDAATFMTGSVVNVDGGWVAR